VADALASIHQQGIIHCDLKPQNIMLTRSGVKLLDFGISQLRHADQPPKDTAATAGGTLRYMAPEQVERGETDIRTDIFAFGGVIYHMVTGQAPFQDNNPTSLKVCILNQEPIPISNLVPGISSALDFFIGRCLAKSPSDRWQSHL
jgi:serine/threonine protein kinase